jgi:diacylglycerol O-acyltransferase / wax synthase
MALDRLSAQDVQILRLERGPIRGHICKIVMLEPPGPSVDELRARIDARLDATPRLRRRLLKTPLNLAPPIWADDTDFHIERHVVDAGTATSDDLNETVADLMAQRLDRAHPLWRMDVLDLGDEGTALVWRIHHCMCDGATSVKLADALLWSDKPQDEEPPPGDWRPADPPSAARLLASGIAARIRRRRQNDKGDAPVRVSRTAVNRELKRSAAKSTLDARIGTTRSVAFARAPLEETKQAGKAIDPKITLNDMVLAITARGIRKWLDHTHGPTEGIRVKVPVSLHHAGEGEGIGNRDSYFFVDLPVSEPDPSECVRTINRETTQRKLDHDAESLYKLGLHRTVAHYAMSPRVFTFNVSNVPGPRSDVYVKQSRVTALYSIAEVAQHHALRVSVISAAGNLFFGLCADREAVKDLDVLADGLNEARDELLARDTHLGA